MSEQLALATSGRGLATHFNTTATNLWTKCPQCRALVHSRYLEQSTKVCPECQYHFRLTARERISLLLDANSFHEYAANLTPEDPLNFVDTQPYPDRIAENRRKTGDREAAIYGTGSVAGYLLVICVLDFHFLGGSMGAVVGEKVSHSAELALELHVPLLICSASGGARMQEGALSLMQMAKTSAALARLSEEGLPYFSLLCDPTYGGVSASFATLGDIIIAEPKARIGFAGPQVIEQTTRQTLPPGFQTAEFLLEKGQIDLVVPRAQLRGTFKELLSHYAHLSRTTGMPVQSTAPRDEIRSTGSRTAWESVQLARHPGRPNIKEYIATLFDSFIELHGDRTFRDDQSIVGGLARLEGRPVMVIGHQKGTNTRENIECNFGMPYPEGYRKALRLMQLAGRQGIPLLTFIDTPGAYPGIGAEERNQSEAIARNLFVMSRLPIPIICTIIGEGGSGGALALGVGDRILILENAIYAVISPEGCSTILFKDAAKAPQAAEASRLTAHELHKLGVVDEIVPEPPGGAHTDKNMAINAVREALIRNLDELLRIEGHALIDARYARFRSFGKFSDTGDI